jgi:hypothetical protein|tara:strand:- start:847 stop:1014 length:168 start_codon:yes stop_codon:yes gene_type:complete
MAKISEVVATIEGPDFDQQNVQNLANNVISIVQKMNTTYQQQLKDELEAFTLFVD